MALITQQIIREIHWPNIQSLLQWVLITVGAYMPTFVTVAMKINGAPLWAWAYHGWLDVSCDFSCISVWHVMSAIGIKTIPAACTPGISSPQLTIVSKNGERDLLSSCIYVYENPQKLGDINLRFLLSNSHYHFEACQKSFRAFIKLVILAQVAPFVKSYKGTTRGLASMWPLIGIMWCELCTQRWCSMIRKIFIGCRLQTKLWLWQAGVEDLRAAAALSRIAESVSFNTHSYGSPAHSAKHSEQIEVRCRQL